MNTLLRTRTMGLAALALTASMGLAACGSESDTDSAAETTTSETPAEEVLALKPDGVFLSNGPGDPAAVDYEIGRAHV